MQDKNKAHGYTSVMDDLQRVFEGIMNNTIDLKEAKAVCNQADKQINAARNQVRHNKKHGIKEPVEFFNN